MIGKELLITSRQNENVKKLCALTEKKQRAATRLFRFDGVKLFREATLCGLETERVFIKESSSREMWQSVGEELERLDPSQIFYLSDELFLRVSEEKSPQGIITVAKYIDKLHKSVKIYNEDNLPCAQERVILLESIRDAGNLGTMIRCAASLGVSRLVISSDCADIYNSKTIRAAMGGLFRLRIDMLDDGEMPRYISALRESGRRVFAAALDERAVNLGSFALTCRDCFVIGNEGHGLCEETLSACDGSVIIPMQEGCESLNAACAATILIWEQRRASTTL